MLALGRTYQPSDEETPSARVGSTLGESSKETSSSAHRRANSIMTNVTISSPALASLNLNPAPTTSTAHPADRSDIHKSCRTIEVLAVALKDYCEAARAFAATQKKLVRALKDAAGIKAGVEYAANALSTTASIFEVLADVDAKFAKIADKECGSVNAEVKKWFKKLAKEEKAHDDRMNESNAKIKQAGQSYEKKSKKGTRDAGEEHARYINLLSVIGPEMSQEKHNHAMYVAQQHASTMFGVAACLARIADAEWARTCESMRRFAPTIGPLGEWRALCEGTWSGPLPDDLPDASSPRAQVLTPHSLSPTPTMTTAAGSTAYGNVVSEWGTTTTSERLLPVPPGGGGFNPGSSPSVGNIPSELPRLPYASNTYNSTNTQSSTATNDSVNSDGHSQRSVNSITTLSAFPLPPTHIPGPVSATPVSQVAEAQRQQHHQVQQIQNIHAALSHIEIQNHALNQAHPELSGSPLPTESLLGADAAAGMSDAPRSPRIPPPTSHMPSVSRQNSGGFPEERSRPGSSMEHRTPFSSNPPLPPMGGGEPPRPRRRSIIGRPPLPSPAPKSPLPPVPVLPSPTLAFRPDSPFKRSEQTDREFGVQKDGASAGNATSVDGGDRGRSAFKSRSIDGGRKTLVRSESTGSNVAALKNRYSQIIEAPSQGPKDVPRLPMSVSEMASRYQPVDEPMSPRRMAASPSTDRFPPLTLPSETPMRQMARDMQIDENEIRKRKQRIEELAELELKEREYALRQRERELNQRSRELERDKLQFLHFRPDSSFTANAANVGDGPKGLRNNRFTHKRGSQSVSHIIVPHPSSSSSSIITTTSNPTAIVSTSTPHLPLPMPIQTPLPSPAKMPSHSPSRSQSSTPLPAKDHAPFCGCDTCSVAKYRLSNTSPSPRDLRPPEPPIMLRPEKPKGWIRRLSMPSVSGALSLDAAKKHAASLRDGLSLPVGENGRLRKTSFEQDVAGNTAVTAVGRR
ncbi:hypothetical protein BKA83DRAFT_10504 [Pisolithus microcarpus]|nr:hypothetical protein BKA83DRAFT_10504 [Pisolithus microcarpus]